MKRPCKHPGCAALLDRSGYCEAHAASAPKPRANYQAWRQRDPQQSAIDRFRSSPSWKSARKHKRAAQPLCADPYGSHAADGSTHSTTQIHHIHALATHPHLGLVADNLMGVCTACHARLEADAKRATREP